MSSRMRRVDVARAERDDDVAALTRCCERRRDVALVGDVASRRDGRARGSLAPGAAAVTPGMGASPAA